MEREAHLRGSRTRGRDREAKAQLLFTSDPAVPMLCADPKQILANVGKEVQIKTVLCEVIGTTISRKTANCLCRICVTMDYCVETKRMC